MQPPDETPDPHDPLARRPDDPMLFRRWGARLYDRNVDGAPVRGPLIIASLLVLIGLVAVAVVLLTGAP